MTSQPQAVKTLSTNAQKKSIKGLKKQKRSVIKNTLENPFALEWPSISSEDEEEIKVLLQKSCLGLKKLTCKPPWKEVKKFKGAERKTFITEHKRQFQENLHPDSARLNKEADEALSHLILGYNAVMRALEKDRIAGVLVKKNVHPLFVVKTFLPGCANKCIPLLPLNDLDSLLKKSDSLALPHACMVLGLKPSVRDEKNRFHALYVKMSEALEIDVAADEEEEEEMEHSQEDPTVKGRKQKSSHSLSKEEIQSYHLKRTHTSKRVFVPGGGEEQSSATASFESDFISFGPSVTEPDLNIKREYLFDKKPKKITIEPLDQAAIQVISHTLKEEKDSSMFMIDEKGDDSLVNEAMKHENLGTEGKDSPNKEKPKKKKKRKMDSATYVPAKTKRLKGNPNRKTNAKN